MSKQVSENLAEFLTDRVGDDLRSVIHYRPDDYDIVYLRSEIGEQYTREEIEGVIDELRLQAFEKAHQEDFYTHGSLQCSVFLYDEALELNFPLTDFQGTGIAIDVSAAPDIVFS